MPASFTGWTDAVAEGVTEGAGEAVKVAVGVSTADVGVIAGTAVVQAVSNRKRAITLWKDIEHPEEKE
jgi:hypothetical protein